MNNIKKQLRKPRNMSFIPADAYYVSISDIPLSLLESWHIEVLFIDRDNTCVPRSTRTIPADVSAWFDALAAHTSIRAYIVSNNIHTEAVNKTAQSLGIKAISHAMKPSCSVMVNVMKKHGIAPEHACVIGDQLFTDILAGKRGGTRTILVKPQSRRDLWYTYVLRVIEWIVLRRVTWMGAHHE